MRTIVLSLFCFFSATLFAQQLPDTIFYDLGWKISNRANAFFYRITVKEEYGFSVQDHYINGTLQMTGFYTSFDPDNKHGVFTYYNEDGVKVSVGRFKKNKKVGEWIHFYKSGLLKSKENFENGELNDTTKFYFETGELRRIEVYDHDSLVVGKCYRKNGSDTAYFPAEEAPRYVGGESALRQFIASNIDYPRKARKNEIQGRVYVKFKIKKDGRVDEIFICRGVHPLLDGAAMDVIKKLPPFIPAKNEGAPVEVDFTVPINFLLE